MRESWADTREQVYARNVKMAKPSFSTILTIQKSTPKMAIYGHTR